MLNADYYDAFPHADRAPLAVVPEQRRLAARGPSGWPWSAPDRPACTPPTSCSRTPSQRRRLRPAADALRAGPCRGRARPPAHQAGQPLFAPIEEQPGFRYRLGVEVGRDLTLAELEEHYDAVVYAVGACADRRLGVPGEELPARSRPPTWWVGTTATPTSRTSPSTLDHERAVVVGNGNVALDVARILTADPSGWPAPTSRRAVGRTRAAARSARSWCSDGAGRPRPRSRCRS